MYSYEAVAVVDEYVRAILVARPSLQNAPKFGYQDHSVL